MHAYPIDPADEARHAPDGERFWNESYYMDFHRDDGSLGGYVRIGLYPELGATWYWACLVGNGRPLVMITAHDAPLPSAGSLDFEHSGLRATHRCEDPNLRFRVGLEGRAQVFENPAQVYQVPLSATPADLDFDLDLLWETDGPGGYRFRQMDRYEIPCQVRGRIRVGDESIAFEGHGQRDHSWGVRDWWAHAWSWNAGRLEDGTRFHSVAPRTLDGQDIPFAAGYVQAPGKPLDGVHTTRAREELDAEGLPTSGNIEVGDLHLEVSPAHFAPVLLVDPDGRVSRFPRCLARYRAGDGRAGLGWIEWNQPQV